MRVLLDTHTWVWMLTQSAALSETARRTLSRADEVFISPASVYEIAQKIRRNAWPGMSRENLSRMIQLPSEESGIEHLPLTPAIMSEAGLLEWEHRDPFDRMIAATAIMHHLAVVTKDAKIAAFDDVESLW